ncbi:MAG: JAB domain-containing protein, partial [Stomatobaculum sp.]|nr:JAB domain-containing protein [Stomatobaculum sp.]
MPEKRKAADLKRYKLKEVCVRLAEGHPLYSDWPIDSPGEAIKVMRGELSRYDREVLCVVNLNTRKQPINFHVVSVGELNQSIASIPNILKTGILSNAGSFLLAHNHPSGDVMPSQDDIQTTKRVIEAGKILGIPCLDHIIIGGGNGNYFSMREEKTVDFT